MRDGMGFAHRTDAEWVFHCEELSAGYFDRAAGRCQYAGCNAPLIGDDISGSANANKAYIGHITGHS